ncbi:growth inhibitor PemK [Methylobacterium oryzihabitans]|uniref:Growth inhibitor PemK n=1 Tax=Methylobacterium oryzihabitans TaxID=2499852 RepID=A0A3S2VFE1_9HYPH|nr:growth inhibitor PemK [Methylobacterium oryzihabitans]RVU21714.1 growth inhibitor PemK [Methylobacterium oryzihabitans]
MALPEPEPGLVVSYAYLWHREAVAGLDEGRKDHPGVIVLSVRQPRASPMVTVLPITHSPPHDQAAAVEIPAAVKRHLRLDDAPSWIVVSEGNVFDWPGYDLRPTVTGGGYAYGFLPPRLFSRVVTAFAGFHRRGRSRLTSRS